MGPQDSHDYLEGMRYQDICRMESEFLAEWHVYPILKSNGYIIDINKIKDILKHLPVLAIAEKQVLYLPFKKESIPVIVV